MDSIPGVEVCYIRGYRQDEREVRGVHIMSGYNHVHEFGVAECNLCGAEKCEICGDDVERYEANHAEPIERFHQ